MMSGLSKYKQTIQLLLIIQYATGTPLGQKKQLACPIFSLVPLKKYMVLLTDSIHINMQAIKQRLQIAIREEAGQARRLAVTLAKSQKTIETPSYILSTKGGALNGIIKHNLKDTHYPGVALSFHDMHEYTKTLTKFGEHLSTTQPKEETSLLKRFFRYEDKLVWLTPFSHSTDKERTGGFNDDEHFLLNLKTKVHVREYFEMAQKWGADFVVAPCEQVTASSGKKKRKRSLKAAGKHTNNIARVMREEQVPILTSVMLGDENGLDNFEMRHYIKAVLQKEEGAEDPQEAYDGFMIYGTDVLEYPQRYSDIKEFLAQTDKNKVRATLGLGSPVEILNGVLAGIDIFESDYPLKFLHPWDRKNLLMPLTWV